MKKYAKKIFAFILIAEAKLVLRKYKPKIAVITGSVGKSLAKEALGTVLSAGISETASVKASRGKIRKNEDSSHDNFGVALTILGIKSDRKKALDWVRKASDSLFLILFRHQYPEWLILEVSADRPDDVKKVASWVHPDIVIITSLSEVPSHIEFFPSLSKLIEEEFAFVENLKPQGVLIYNADDEKLGSYAASSEITHKKIAYGFQEQAEVQANSYAISYSAHGKSRLKLPAGMNVTVSCAGLSTPLELRGIAGHPHAYALLAAFAVGISQNMQPVQIAKAMKEHEYLPGRIKIIAGAKDSLVVDDSLNSSPAALHTALETLKEMRITHKKIAMIGDMLELGNHSISEHKKAGKHAAKIADILVTVGVRARAAAESALESKMSRDTVLCFDTPAEAGKHIAENLLGPGDVVLVKGSKLMRMEKAVEAMMKYPEEKENFLVRQEKHWQKR